MRIVKSLLLITALSFLSPTAGAVSESDFVTSIKTRVLPFIKANLVKSTFKSFDGTRIEYGLLKTPHSRATVILSQGRTESIIGLSEVIYDLAHMGYSVAVVDHRGQGESQRLVQNSTVGHVGSFFDYVDDFKIFVDRYATATLPGPYLLMASSMGAAIGSFYLIEEPATFSAAALGAPMVQIDLDPFPLAFIDAVASGFEYFEPLEHFAPTRQPYNFNQTFEGNDFTHSRQRFYLDLALTRKNPVIATGGPSLGWLREAVKAGNRLTSEANRVRTPLLIFQAGHDDIVENASQTAFCKAAAHCRIETFPGAYHWIFMETDPIRNRLFLDLDAFFETSLAAVKDRK